MFSQLDHFQCPGESYPISRAIHLGRLTRHYAACGHCPHRHDTAPMSPTIAARLSVGWRAASELVADGNALIGTLGETLDAGIVRRLAIAFAMRRLEADGERNVVLASDGRPETAHLLAAAAEGLRLAGCDVLDIGPAGWHAARFAAGTFNSGGGVLIGNPTRLAHRAGMSFWQADRPLEESQSQEVLSRSGTTPERVARTSGRLQRRQATEEYLAGLRPWFHALRPLCVAVDTACSSFWRYLGNLSRSAACQFLPVTRADAPVDRSRPGEPLGRTVRQSSAHLGMSADGDARTCQVVDEHGEPVEQRELIELLGEHNCRDPLQLLAALLAALSRDDRSLREVLDERAACR